MSPILSQLVLDERLRPWRCRAALLLFCLIVIIGAIPGARNDIGTLASGIVLHGAAYSCLTFLLYTGIAGTAPQRAAKAALTAMAMGAFDELVQSFLPYRHGTLTDWLIDASAALLTAGLLWALLPLADRRRQA